MENFISKKIVLEPSAGATLSRGINEAIQMACKEDCIVQFTANGKTFVIDPKDLIEHIENDFKIK